MGTRFFVALLPPIFLQEQVTAIKTSFCERFQSCAALKSPPHITLQPPFEHPPDQRHTLTQLLTDCAAQMPDLHISLKGFGAFPPRVIYIDVVPNPELLNYQQPLTQTLQSRLGIRGDRRPFCPHMAVAFRDLTTAAFHEAWPEFQRQSFEFTFTARALTLLRHDGHQWQVAATYSNATHRPPDPGQGN
jgi:2'-5' RNA ligase